MGASLDVPRINIAATIFAAQGTLLNDLDENDHCSKCFTQPIGIPFAATLAMDLKSSFLVSKSTQMPHGKGSKRSDFQKSGYFTK